MDFSGKIKRFAYIVGINLVIVGVLLVIVESVVRTFYPYHLGDAIQIYKYEDTLGYTLHNNLNYTETSDFRMEFQTNELGTNNLSNSFENYPKHIIALGDSYTQGFGGTTDASYPFQLDLLLNQDSLGFYQPQFSVVNLGISGYGGQQNLIRLQQFLPQLPSANYLLYLGCDNDWIDDQMFKKGYRHRSSLEGNPRWGIWQKSVQFLFHNLHIGRYVRNMGGSNRRANQTLTDSISVAQSQLPILEKLQEIAQTNNMELIVSWANTTNSYRWLKEWSSENQILFADWHPKIQKVQAQYPNILIENQHSGKHYRVWVNRIMAEEFGRMIQNRE